jgi:hypothetical protein
MARRAKRPHLRSRSRARRAGYTNREFVEAYYAVLQRRWEASLEAKQRADEDGSMNAIGPILHGVIDLHWPNRVERDSSGAIHASVTAKSWGALKAFCAKKRRLRVPLEM